MISAEGSSPANDKLQLAVVALDGTTHELSTTSATTVGHFVKQIREETGNTFFRLFLDEGIDVCKRYDDNALLSQTAINADSSLTIVDEGLDEMQVSSRWN
jgi:hypothetical protein